MYELHKNDSFNPFEPYYWWMKRKILQSIKKTTLPDRNPFSTREILVKSKKSTGAKQVTLLQERDLCKYLQRKSVGACNSAPY